jgi:hypothetical protein
MGCSVQECENPHYSKGFCISHYRRWRKYGDPLESRKPGRPKRTCTIDGCDNPRAANGLCDKHRKRKDRNGEPLALRRLRGQGEEARWWFYVDRRGDGECWPWTGSVNDEGYGHFWDGEAVGMAHIWGYERFVRPVPPGLHLDHVRTRGCTMRNCVNYLSHLEPVTNRENVLRGDSTKLSDETVAVLHGLHLSGRPVAELALAAGVHRTTLHRRFRRLENTSTPG